MKGISVSLVALVACVQAVSAGPDGPGHKSCKTDPPPKYPRSFTGFALSPKNKITNSKLGEQALGDCVTPEQHAENMRTYFKGYGVEPDTIKDPYAVNNHDPRYEIIPFTTSPESDECSRILVSTFYEFSTYRNAKFTTANWVLRAKAALNGTRGEMPAGTWAVYGVHRFIEHGKSFCVRFNDVAPKVHTGGNTATVLSLEAYHVYWGEGEIEGVYRSTEKFDNFQFFVNFPG